MTLEGWGNIMYNIRAVTGTKMYDIYFILILVCGAFFVLNLIFAVQSVNFMWSYEAEVIYIYIYI